MGLLVPIANPAPVSHPVRGHRPAIATATCFAAGIVIDHVWRVSLPIWITLVAVGVVASLILYWFADPHRNRSRAVIRLASGVTLLTVLLAGGLRHHVAIHRIPSDDISRFSSEEPRHVRLRAVIASPVQIQDAPIGPRIPSWMETDRSTTVIRCEAIDDSGTFVAVSGLVRMEVSGQLVHVRVGDQVEILGRLAVPSRPANPGAMDFGLMLRRKGISATLRVDHPAAVIRRSGPTSWGWKLARLREQIRSDCLQLFRKHLSEPNAAVASSVLIGDRTMLADELKDQFAQTGTMHLLAISGLHVGILLGLALLVCRCAEMSSSQTVITLSITILLYLLITDLGPSVLRAAILAVIALFGAQSGRLVDRMNALAACALVLLIWHPMDLFDLGAQLSFLGVGAILWSLSWQGGQYREPETLTEMLEESTWWRRVLKKVRRYLVESYRLMGAILLVTLPVTMSTFHLVSPVGLILNLVLIPYMTLVLALGYLFLLGGLVSPLLANLLGVPFGWALTLLRVCVEWGQQIPGGYFYLPNLPHWWLIGFYVCLGLAWQLIGTARSARWFSIGLLGWCVVGLLIPFVPRAEDRQLRCTFLSVGHGLACLIEFPGGETMLYDAGTIGDGQRVSRSIQNLMWTRGRHRLDAVMVSHADHDHFSGLFDLMEKVPIRTLFIAPAFLDFEQSGVVELCERAQTAGIDLQLVQAHDRLRVRSNQQESLHVEVLYPPARLSPRSDNASSIQLQIDYAGRRILLTGDLEKEGLTDLLSLPPRQVDVMLSPHHGGRVPGVLKLYEWARPEYAIVSSSNRELPALRDVLDSCQILNTATSGAITVTITPQGELTVEEWLRPTQGDRSRL